MRPVLIVVFCSVITFAQQVQYRTHMVKKSETIKEISKKYNVSVKSILDLNPDIENGKIQEKDILIIPVSKKPLKNQNPQLINRKQKKADSPTISAGKGNTLKQKLNQGIKHIVKKGETIWSVSRKYNLSVETLKRLNPDIENIIKIGQRLIVHDKPKDSTQEQRVENSLFKQGKKLFLYYVVKPKETLYSLSKKFDISIRRLKKINKVLKNKILQAGMALKIPKKEGNKAIDSILQLGVDNQKSSSFNKHILDSVHNYKQNPWGSRTVNMSLVLPLRLNGRAFHLSSEELKVKIAKDRLLNYSLDFYFGVITAVDSLKKSGLSLDLKVIDSDIRASVIREEITKGTFDNVDLVLGPFYPKPFNELSAFLDTKKIPILSPLSNKDILARDNVIYTLPKKDQLKHKLVKYIAEKIKDSSVFIIADDKNKDSVSLIKSFFPNAKVIDPLNQKAPMVEVLKNAISTVNKNIFFLETSDVSIIRSTTSILNSLVSENVKIQLITTDRSNKYDNNVSNVYMSNLQFTYPTVNRHSSKNKSYINKYIETYGIYPNKYVIRGFDIVFDVLSRMMQDKNWFANICNHKTEYLENRFQYIPSSEGYGYSNVGSYIVQFSNMEYKQLK